MVDLVKLDRLAGRRHGLTTTTGLLAAGFTYRDIESLERRGILARVRRGVFRTVGSPLTQEQAYLAAVLASGEGAALSHLTAARLWRFPALPEPDAIDVLREGRTHPKGPGIRGHTTLALPHRHRTSLWGIPITTPERTFFDVCSVVPPRALARSADELVRQKRMTDVRLRQTLDDIPASGRRAIRPAIEYLKSRPIGFQRGANDRELDVMRVLKQAGVAPLPEQQVEVRVASRCYVLDYAWVAAKNALEFMGFDPHGNLVSRFHHDADRTRNLQRIGWCIWPVTVVTTPEEIVDLGHFLAAKTPPPESP